MRLMKLLWGVAGAVVLAVGCNVAPVDDPPWGDTNLLATESHVSVMKDDDDDNGGECPPPPCSVACGRSGQKVRVCHRAPPDSPGGRLIELCISASGAAAHLREHDEDTLGCCPEG
jgi:hypothetical protein